MSQPSVLNERGGFLANQNYGAKNYMRYISGGAYDDDNYTLYAPANYENISMQKDDKNSKNDTNESQYNRTENSKGFEVLGNKGDSNYYHCPNCNKVAVRTCGCQYKDSLCPNNHSWHLDNGKRQSGISPNHK